MVVPVPAGATMLILKSFAVSTTEVAPADGVTVSVATGSGGIDAWAATAEVNAAPVGDGVDTPAVIPAGSADADTLGCNSIAAPLAICTGAGNSEVVSGWMLRDAVYWVPVTVEVLAVSVTVKSCVTAVPPAPGVQVYVTVFVSACAPSAPRPRRRPALTTPAAAALPATRPRAFDFSTDFSPLRCSQSTGVPAFQHTVTVR
ncbi:hypothetical protein Msi02_69510 [Microbispora siamensis]|uniref:Secreted protein n=1 Tax=Microbispora siamensis TaxID=564413 RepID=A0ABQ4GXU3_9ACTN|nr:hypothetical protein Msi02_69510 [Microbispora siamensis]